MTSTRLEAFSDAVIAIIMTIMVLELKVPHGENSASVEALSPLAWTFIAYLLSFVYLGIYWNNHHHMLQATQKVNGKILWANMHLLFWLSLVPFVTGWMGENRFAPLPTAVYGVVLLLCAVSYAILQATIVSHEKHENDLLAEAVRGDLKGKISIACYLAAIPIAFFYQAIAGALYAIVALMWLIPDRRIEEKLAE